MFADLKEKFTAVSGRQIISLFDDQRAEDFSVRADGLFFDYSKTNIDDETRAMLLALLGKIDLPQKRAAMFSGEKINITEDRAVLHTALRRTSGPLIVEGCDVMEQVLTTRARLLEFAEAVRSGAVQGQGGAYTDVVNIGIGGSDLGPAMAYLALKPYAQGPRCHFVSNVDGAHVTDVLENLDPRTTLVIVASKTFTTIETLTNAQTALRWMAAAVERPADHFVALSTAREKTSAFGIAADRVFGFEDWVGGRYSVWGPIGLSLAIAIGAEHFRAFLNGAETMDRHFQTAAAQDNLPVMLALVGVWHAQVAGYATRAVLPYEQRLSRFPAYLQQLEMESNGKGVGIDGQDLLDPSGPIVWGEPGTNGQHAFYQLIHQGQHIIPCEFMLAKEGHEPQLAHQHHLLQANCLAQSQALMLGRDLPAALKIAKAKGFEGAELERQARHRVFKGNRPSTTLIYPKLTPFCLGQLIALYEHRVFVEGMILGINSFDQWGVELGKELATALEPVVKGDSAGAHNDPSTVNLVAQLRS
ncbi:MAG: glucose-6-phosphate isomerase [Planktomarina sp.]|jgi:glucose-6-phosphate isomerase|nr:glucose-6-phosphate isomerase [Planktomarina sp.]MDG1746093.1 glucose-6-phosphate isomerase [Planktomarina sp.]